MICVRLPQLGLFAAVVATALSFAQTNQSTLKIESPANGSVVNPGQTVKIRVVSAAGAAISFVGVVGEDPLGMSELVKSVPAEFSITIPSKINACRRYMVTAIGRTPGGAELLESMIDLDVERPDTPVSIVSFQFPSLTLVADPKAQPFHLIILATFADRSNVEVTESSYVTYQSTNDAVATVERFGGVTAVAPGITSIKVTYKNPNGGSVQVSVPVIVEPPTKN
ncbi:MAG TPA: Ig-like domain-containing protein [Candidatus Angelobacter sp.]|jgi:hypothetical protein